MTGARMDPWIARAPGWPVVAALLAVALQAMLPLFTARHLACDHGLAAHPARGHEAGRDPLPSDSDPAPPDDDRSDCPTCQTLAGTLPVSVGPVPATRAAGLTSSEWATELERRARSARTHAPRLSRGPPSDD